MYTEVKELVNFLAKYLIGRIPRRPASLFTCQLANFLICRFREHKWDLNEPSKDEQHRVVRSKVNGFTDQLIISAATEMGLCPDEVLECLPDNILLFANPGEVFYRAGENAAAVPIWTGEKGVDPDISYCSLPAFVTNPACAAASPTSNMGAAGKPFYVGRSRKTDAAFEIEDAYVQLKLEPAHSASTDDNVLLPQSDLMMFSYTPKNHVSYTIKEFSATRFGSHRQRPDHDVMKRIQRQAANRGAGFPTNSGSNSSKTRTGLLEAGDGPELKNTAAPRPTFPKSSTSQGDTTLKPCAEQLLSCISIKFLINMADNESNIQHTVQSKNVSYSARSSLPGHQAQNNMADIETLKTLTSEQREALVNIIRNSSMLDHSLSHLQQALVGPQVVHNAGLPRLPTISPVTTSVTTPSIAELAFSHYGTNPITTAASALSRRHNAKRRSSNHNSSWIV